MSDCWFCDDTARDDPPPGGWLVDDGTWRAGHAPPSYAVAGTVILESRRHVADQGGFDDLEAASYAAVAGRLIDAVTAVTGAQRVYQWATMDRHAHFHQWLVPWYGGELRGPRYLCAAIVDTDGCPPGEASATAARLADALRST